MLCILCMCSICAYTHVFCLRCVFENSSCWAFARCVCGVSVARSVRAAALGFVRHICGNKLCHVAMHSAGRVLFQLSSICVLAMLESANHIAFRVFVYTISECPSTCTRAHTQHIHSRCRARVRGNLCSYIIYIDSYIHMYAAGRIMQLCCICTHITNNVVCMSTNVHQAHFINDDVSVPAQECAKRIRTHTNPSLGDF